MNKLIKASFWETKLGYEDMQRHDNYAFEEASMCININELSQLTKSQHIRKCIPHKELLFSYFNYKPRINFYNVNVYYQLHTLAGVSGDPSPEPAILLGVTFFLRFCPF